MAETVFLIGCAIAIIGAIWFIVEAFKVHIFWGLCCLLLGPVSLIFVFKYWQESRYPCYVQLSGAVIAVTALYLGGSFQLI